MKAPTAFPAPERPNAPPLLHTMQPVHDDTQLVITRLRVAGGWLYITTADNGGLGQTFVPDPTVYGPGD